jgi:hypothetical protein
MQSRQSPPMLLPQHQNDEIVINFLLVPKISIRLLRKEFVSSIISNKSTQVYREHAGRLFRDGPPLPIDQ